MRIVVVGGGIAGLAAAMRVRELRPDAVLTVVEQAAQPGGKLRTGVIAGAGVELGAESFLVRDPAAVELAMRLGLDVVHPAGLSAAVAFGGGMHPLPPGTVMGIPADAPEDDRGEPVLAPGQDVAVGALVRSRIGDEIVDRYVDPLLGGVYAGRADDLSVRATMPNLATLAETATTLTGAVRMARAATADRAGGPIFGTIAGGMSRLVEAVAAAAKADIRLGLPVRELAPTPTGWRLAIGATRDPVHLDADGVVLAVPARPAARLLEATSPDAAAEVGALDYASVALVTLAFPAGTVLPDISGFLVPATEGYAIKAATYFTQKWPHLAGGPVLVRASVGRYGEEHALQHDDPGLVALVREELSAFVELPAPVATSVTRWGGGLPQYRPGHLDRVERARAAVPPTLTLAGAAYDGVGIPACVRSGQAAAAALVATLADYEP